MTRPGKPYSAKTNTSSARRLTTVPAQAHPRIAFIGAGRVGRSLACAFQRAGVPVVGYVARDQKSAPEDTAGDGLLAGIPRLSLAEAALQADWLWLTVPDDHIAHVADTIAWRDHHVAVHCSGATELTAMRSAQNAGAALVGFHPLQIFSQPRIAVDTLPGSRVGIEIAHAPSAPAQRGAQEDTQTTPLQQQATALAQAIGLTPLFIRPGQRALYHAGAGYAASALISMLAEAANLWALAGIESEDMLDALLPLASKTIAAAEAAAATNATNATRSAPAAPLGHAIAGPVARADIGVIQRHLQALETHGLDVALYRSVAEKQVALLGQAGALTTTQLDAVKATLAVYAPR